jgi:hypothetical protein
MVRIHPDPPHQVTEGQGQVIDDTVVAAAVASKAGHGAVAQLGEHLLCKQGVTGSIPVSSTSIRRDFDSRESRSLVDVIAHTF